jgi:hypothetical protein
MGAVVMDWTCSWVANQLETAEREMGQGGSMRVYPKVSGLVAWSENCKWYSSLPLGAVVSLYYESV